MYGSAFNRMRRVVTNGLQVLAGVWPATPAPVLVTFLLRREGSLPPGASEMFIEPLRVPAPVRLPPLISTWREGGHSTR